MATSTPSSAKNMSNFHKLFRRTDAMKIPGISMNSDSSSDEDVASSVATISENFLKTKKTQKPDIHMNGGDDDDDEEYVPAFPNGYKPQSIINSPQYIPSRGTDVLPTFEPKSPPPPPPVNVAPLSLSPKSQKKITKRRNSLSYVSTLKMEAKRAKHIDEIFQKKREDVPNGSKKSTKSMPRKDAKKRDDTIKEDSSVNTPSPPREHPEPSSTKRHDSKKNILLRKHELALKGKLDEAKGAGEKECDTVHKDGSGVNGDGGKGDGGKEYGKCDGGKEYGKGDGGKDEYKNGECGQNGCGKDECRKGDDELGEKIKSSVPELTNSNVVESALMQELIKGRHIDSVHQDSEDNDDKDLTSSNPPEESRIQKRKSESLTLPPSPMAEYKMAKFSEDIAKTSAVPKRSPPILGAGSLIEITNDVVYLTRLHKKNTFDINLQIPIKYYKNVLPIFNKGVKLDLFVQREKSDNLWSSVSIKSGSGLDNPKIPIAIYKIVNVDDKIIHNLNVAMNNNIAFTEPFLNAQSDKNYKIYDESGIISVGSSAESTDKSLYTNARIELKKNVVYVFNLSLNVIFARNYINIQYEKFHCHLYSRSDNNYLACLVITVLDNYTIENGVCLMQHIAV